MTEKYIIEKRVIRDDNGFYRAQVRILHEGAKGCEDDWRTFLVSPVKEHAEEAIGKQEEIA